MDEWAYHRYQVKATAAYKLMVTLRDLYPEVKTDGLRVSKARIDKVITENEYLLLRMFY